MHDLVVRGGLVVDGTGTEPVEADVAVDRGLISRVGEVDDRGREEVDASGLVVTPGFIDPHTHYDGQVTWDDLVTPSVWHGVTTVVMGNCGVGFAPVAPDQRDWLISLMEGVEDIPGASLRAAMRWDWESVEEYLDALDRMPRAIDVGVQIAHGPLRAYVMGGRGADNEPATADELHRMASLVRRGVQAGAIGISTNRLPLHMAADQRPVPGTFAGEDELFALGRAARDGSPDTVFALILPTAMGYAPDSWGSEIEWMSRLSRETGLAFTFGFGAATVEGNWSTYARDVERENASGARLHPMVGCRRQGMLLGLDGVHPFASRSAYREISDLPLVERARRMADPEVRRRILFDGATVAPEVESNRLFQRADSLFPLTTADRMEPDPAESLASTAGRTGMTVPELFYDALLAREGSGLVNFMMSGYSEASLDSSFEMMQTPGTILGLGDGGAHVSFICDAGYPSFLLGYWARDRRGAQVPLADAIRMLTGDVADLYGLADRGHVAEGRRADLNVIDLDRVGPRYPEVVADLPAAAKRFIQRAEGFVATVVAGEVIQRNGADTGARPGRAVRRGAVGSRRAGRDLGS